MEENKVEQREEGIFAELLFVAKRNLALILAIIILCTMIGGAYIYLRKPNYTASVGVRVFAEAPNQEKYSDDFITTQNYIHSIIDFCDSGVVIDRANYYYSVWRSREDVVLEDFLKENIEYNKNFVLENKDIVASGISTKTGAAKSEYTSIVFHINYTDENKDEALVKVQILAKAFAEESKIVDKYGKQVYFKIDINIESKGVSSVVADISETKILLVSIIAGVFLAAVVVYLKTLLDNGIKTKDELERITGAEVLSAINDISGGRKHASK